jgi:hypothetical protein
MAPRTRLAAAGLGAVLLAVGLAGQILPDSPGRRAKPALGLFTSLPIYWGESAGIDEALNSGNEARHWARDALEEDNRLVPLDTLDGGDLNALERLVMAQPRPLAPGENVALDGWVRAGGRLLLLADPMLTEHSRFMLCDRRRPQDIVLLSPILQRWGLELRYDENQPERRRVAIGDGKAMVVDLAGTLVRVAPGAPAACTLSAKGLIATCRIGKGTATIVADAELLDREGAGSDAVRALDTLVARAFE